MLQNKPFVLKQAPQEETKTFDASIDKLLMGAEELRKRMLLAEKNQDVDMSGTIDDILQSSSNNSAIMEPYKVYNKPFADIRPGLEPIYDYPNTWVGKKSKDAELEALRLKMEYPGDYVGQNLTSVKPAPLPEPRVDYSDIKRHRVFIKFFKVLNPLLRERLRGKRLTLEVLYPVLASSNPAPPEVYKFLTDEDPRLEQFVINQEVDSELDLHKVGVQKLCSNRVGFVIWMKSQDPGTKGKDLEICRGELSLEQVLLSRNFDLKTQIPMRIILEADRIKKVAVPRDQVNKLDVITSEAGVLDLETSFYNPEAVALQKQSQPAVPDSTLEAFSNLMGQTSNPDTRSYRELSSSPVCMFLHVKDVRCAPRRDDPTINRNLYLEHKVYGTPENIQSEVYWNSNSPIMDHKVIIPLDRQSIDMMVDINSSRKRFL